LANELQETYGGKCFCFQASLEKEGVGVELLKKSVEALGGLDLLVNNAGVTRFENILDLTPEVFDLLFHLDFKNSY
jgi:Dehydrogenases with different specificities (related to short-chain alcohol dehydrogenases)